MMGKPAVLLLDAYFFSKTTLMTAAGYIDKNGREILLVITRANSVPSLTRNRRRKGEKGGEGGGYMRRR
jgi:hypothetical protein